MKIKTSFDYPPIPIRTMDWSARYEDNEEGPVGRGPTEQAAIQALREESPECASCGRRLATECCLAADCEAMICPDCRRANDGMCAEHRDTLACAGCGTAERPVIRSAYDAQESSWLEWEWCRQCGAVEAWGWMPACDRLAAVERFSAAA